MTARDFKAERTAFLRSLDWTGPAADLYDTVCEFLWEAECDKRTDPAYADLFAAHFRTREYEDIFLTYERVAEWADRIVIARLK